MDSQKHNHHFDAFIVNADVCAAKLHEWQQKGSNVSVLDLRKVYLDETLWLYQTVKIDGKRSCLTCLGFDLNVAFLIMKPIISTVLSQEKALGSTFIDEIYVNEDFMHKIYISLECECKDLEMVGC